MFEEFIGCLAALLRALEKDLHLPLPEKWRVFSHRFGRKQEAAMVVLAGFLTGAAAAATSCIVKCFFNRFIGALLYALLYTLFWLFHDRGRGDGLLAAKAAAKLPDEYIPVKVIAPISLMILKFALLMVLFYHGGAFYGALVIVGGLALEVFMVMAAGGYPPVMDNSIGARRRTAWVALAALLMVFFSAETAAAFGALIFTLLLRYAEKKVTANGVTMAEIRFWCALCVWLMLLGGVLLI